jgi:predicted ArsR family transcriptional regulator
MAETNPRKFAPLSEDGKQAILSTYMVNPELSLLDKVKIQAQVLVPLLRAFRTALGEEQANQIASTALREWSQQLFQDIGQRLDGSPLQKWTALRAAVMGKALESVEVELLRQEADAIDVNVTGCRYAEFFKSVGEPELGALLLCKMDFDLAAVGNPEVELRRTQTIMEGASHCDFRYKLKKAEGAQENH